MVTHDQCLSLFLSIGPFFAFNSARPESIQCFIYPADKRLCGPLKKICTSALMAMAALMCMFMMLCIMNVLMLVHLSIVIMRVGMFIRGMATHVLSPPILHIDIIPFVFDYKNLFRTNLAPKKARFQD